MRGILAVARREVLEKRLVFAAAAAAALVPFVTPIVRALHGVPAWEARDLLALILAATFAAVLAVVLGFSTLSKDQADRRIGFFFSRPLSGLDIWAGRLLGALFVALAAATIVGAPALAAGGASAARIDLPREAPWVFAASVAALLLLSHAIGVAVRSRSAWLVFDFTAGTLATLVVLLSNRSLATVFGMEVILRERAALVILGLAGLVVGGLLSVARGRTDIRAAHRALSLSLWAIVGTGVLGLAGYTRWVLSATPRSVTEVSFAAPAPRGSWTIVEGPARGFSPAFLMDASSGRFERVGWDWRLPVLSADGAHAAWFEFSDAGADVMTLALEDSASRPVRTRITLPRVPSLALLAAGGERLAAVSRGILSVYDLAAGATVGSARVGEKCGRPAGFFLDSQRLRLFCPSASSRSPGAVRLEILEFDTATRKIARTGVIENVAWGAWSVNAAGNRLLARGPEGITLREGKSGSLIATLRPARPGASGGGRFLSDGRIALGSADEAGTRIEVFSSDGKLQAALPVPASGRIVFGGEAAPGLLVVAAGGNTGERASRTIFVADLASGQVRRAGDRLFPTVYLAGILSGRANFVAAPGSEATKLFYGPGRSLVHFDVLTGDRRVILP